MPKYKELYEKRKETIERVFADAKEKYGMRYTLYRGLTQVTNWVRLKFAAMNLKKLALRKARDASSLRFFSFFVRFRKIVQIYTQHYFCICEKPASQLA